MIRQDVLLIQSERISSNSITQDYTAFITADDEISDDSILTPNSSKALDIVPIEIKHYIDKLEKERKEFKNKCNDKDKRILLLEKNNEELQAKIRKLKGPCGSVQNEPTVEEESEHNSLEPPALDVDMKGDPSLSSYMNQTQLKSVESLSNRSPTNSVLREYDLPGTVKQRSVGSLTSPWRRKRFLKNVGFSRRSSSRKVSVSPPQESGRSPLSPASPASQSPKNMRDSMAKSSSQPELMSPERREVAQQKLQKLKKTSSGGPRSRSPRRKQGYAIQVDGIRGIYTGPTKDHAPHGVGSVVFVNGDTYIGSVVNGKLHGAGTLYYASNKKKQVDRGVWRNNELWQ